MDNLDIEQLNFKNKQLEKYRKKTYNQVKKQCYNKINIVSKTGKKFCWYIIPKFIVGHPPINIDECSEYLRTNLSKEPVLYDFFSPNLFYISW